MSEPLVLKARIAAPVDRVRAALTDPVELRGWLAEHVEAGADRFEFWGVSIPEGDAPHQRLVSWEPLTFTWDLAGETTTVSFELAAVGEETSLTLTQSHFVGWPAAATTEEGALALVGTFWGLALANLVEHIEGRALTPRVDLTGSDLSATIDIAASADRVYQALTDQDEFAAWFGYQVGIEPHVGGRWAMGGFENNPSPARVAVAEPGRAFSLDFGPGYGVASWELAESDGRTRLTFVQSGFGDNPPYNGWLGWLSGFAELRRYLEQSDWRSTWVDLVIA
ncbi:SRPBCC family protein [Actinokineospora sp. NBRC 105648]|uniref:SRPBCC family protein n=1 Tax=Actinokineospora sp. NBRC 105648 TaxID=3032206 RepID=UPI0024A38C99|nr:SRPBCC family protein [Actinokineospora sp. NBRC 105648]GLZ38859.1 hypothetical protein Acsp05_24830 [Actinokineospora sp. NBRC 105648]